MKKMHILLMSFAIISLLILGCGKPTNPVEVPLSDDSEVSLAKEAPVVFGPFRRQFETDNLCTGTPMTVFLTRTLTIHSFQQDDPSRHHFNLQQRTDVTTSDGFSGFDIFTVVDNGTGLPGLLGEFFAQTVNFKVNLSNAAGQRQVARFVVHLTATIVDFDGNDPILDVKSSVDKFSARCVGKPD